MRLCAYKEKIKYNLKIKFANMRKEYDLARPEGFEPSTF